MKICLTLLVLAIGCAMAVNMTKPVASTEVGAPAKRCYAFDLHETCQDLEDFDKNHFYPWVNTRDMLRRELASPDLVAFFEKRDQLDHQPVLRLRWGKDVGGCWAREKLLAARPDLECAGCWADGWGGDRCQVRGRYPVTAEMLAKVCLPFSPRLTTGEGAAVSRSLYRVLVRYRARHVQALRVPRLALQGGGLPAAFAIRQCLFRGGVCVITCPVTVRHALTKAKETWWDSPDAYTQGCEEMMLLLDRLDQDETAPPGVRAFRAIARDEPGPLRDQA